MNSNGLSPTTKAGAGGTTIAFYNQISPANFNTDYGGGSFGGFTPDS